MEATYGAINIRKTPKIKVESTATGTIVIERTPLPVDITSCEEPEYSEAQFNVDLRKASKRLDVMVSKAMKEHAKGKTRKFPA